jgi:PAS domain S-box-containing protein
MSNLGDARRSRRSRLAIVLTYAAVSIAWIAVSDVLITVLPEEVRTVLSTAKGTIFVLITAGLLWGVMLVRDARVERERAALAASEERHRLLAERQHDVVYRFRSAPVPGFEYVSPSIEAITGHTPEEHYANPALGLEAIFAEDRLLLARAAGGHEGPVLVRWHGKDGETLYTEHLVTPILDASGSLVAVEGVARDVTARLRADEHYRRLTKAVDATPVGVAVLARRGEAYEVAYANPALLGLTGASEPALVGRNPVDLLAQFGPLEDPALWARFLAGEPSSFETSLRHPDGTAVPVSVLVSPVVGPDDQIESAIAIVLDRQEAVARAQAEARLGLVLDASPAPIVVVSADHIVTEWNPAAERAFGWTASEVVGGRLPLVPDESSAAYRSLHERIAAGEVPASAEMALLHRDGHAIPCRVQAALVPADGASGVGIVVVIEDLTASIEQQHAQARLVSAIDAAGEAILITSLDGTITYVNPAFERVSGYGRDELIGQNPRVLQSGLTSASVYKDLWTRLAAGQVWRGVLSNRRKDGSLFEEEATLSPVFGSDGNPIAYVGVKRDLTLERTLAQGLASELNDRAAVQETMARLELGETPEETAQLLCEALAGFPDIDDALLQHLPPPGGPAVLIGVAGIAASVREAGETADEASSLAVRLRATGGAWSSQQPGAPGMPAHPSDDGTGVTVVAAPVRHRGKPVAVLYLGSRTDAPDAWVARYLRIASELAAHVGPMIGPQLSTRDTQGTSADEIARVIEAGAFEPCFQPICDLRTGIAVGWESLTRFADGIAPARRFADAQAVGLGPQLELACGTRAVEAFKGLGHSGWLSVNLSPSLVLSGRADALIAAAPKPVVLEFTEPVAADDHERLRHAIERLGAPAMIAVDDTGSGYAALRSVLELRPDFLKLDLGLVHEIERDTARQAMVAGMVHYAAQSRTQLIAEGVETEAERRTLARLGVRFGQGLLLGVPSATGTVTDRGALGYEADADPGISAA